MERLESIWALAKLLNSNKKQVSIPFSRAIYANSIDLTVQKTQPTKGEKSFSELNSKPASKLNCELSTLSKSEQRSKHFLEQLFLRNGYLRIRKRKKMIYDENLKVIEYINMGKGYEVRLLPNDDDELQKIREAISGLGLTVSNTFIKHNRIIQPIYGKKLTLDFERLKNNYQPSE